MDTPSISERMRSMGICVIIPTYNNRGTILNVIDDISKYCHNIIVVCDGPTDGTEQSVRSANLPVTVIGYTPNKGKGTALQIGFREALRQGFRYAITIDSDGQHFANDIPKFVECTARHRDALIIGSRIMEQDNKPKKNTFANRFSNFWFSVQTGRRIPDTQSGYRLYPIATMGSMRLVTSRYEAELELLVRCAWRNINIQPLPIEVYYPPEDERVTHFRPGKDFLRITLLNTCLCFIALLYGYPSMLLRKMLHSRN